TFATIKSIREKLARQCRQEHAGTFSSDEEDDVSPFFNYVVPINSLPPVTLVAAVCLNDQIEDESMNLIRSPQLPERSHSHPAGRCCYVELDDEDEYLITTTTSSSLLGAGEIASSPNQPSRRIILGAPLYFRDDILPFYRFLVFTDEGKRLYPVSVAHLQDQCASSLKLASSERASSCAGLMASSSCRQLGSFEGGASIVRHLTVVAETYRLLTDIPQLLKTKEAHHCEAYADKLCAFRWNEVVSSCRLILPFLAKKFDAYSQHTMIEASKRPSPSRMHKLGHCDVHAIIQRCVDAKTGVVSPFNAHKFDEHAALSFYICCNVRRFTLHQGQVVTMLKKKKHETNITRRTKPFMSSAALCKGPIDYFRRLLGAMWACHTFTSTGSNKVPEKAAQG
ncbi:unnamed protein product, partial [Amoebophrya sp. A25]